MDVNPRIVSSAPAASPYPTGTPLHRITSAVNVQITMVSIEYLKEKGHEVIDCGTYNNEKISELD